MYINKLSNDNKIGDLSLIERSLEHGDKARIAEELEIHRNTVSSVFNNTCNSNNTIMMVTEKALEIIGERQLKLQIQHAQIQRLKETQPHFV